jgi:hypothetical protein
MKKFLLFVAAVLLFVAGYAVAERVRDWHDLDTAHGHIQEAIHEMERIQAANHYDMDGHAAKAERFLRQAEHEIGLAVESAKRAR